MVRFDSSLEVPDTDAVNMIESDEGFLDLSCEGTQQRQLFSC